MRRVTLFCGHYGSGKTNVAVNFAFSLRAQGKAVAIGDLDVVNPYFRTKDSEAELKAAGIDVVALPFANSSVDLPSLPAEAYALVQDRSRYAVLDVGGDDRGALALGRYVPYLREENDFDMLFVANFRRPLTPDAASAYEVMREIGAACGLPFTGIVNNTNLGEETTREVIDASRPLADELAAVSGVPVVMTAAMRALCDETMFPLTLQKKYY
ncbi:MAG: hypothetical protein II738_06365 [Clostridia bacterium]|nr:hypothetical protein [Clostridia bacterium]